MTMVFSGQLSPASKQTLTLHALCEFLDDPQCRSCQILEICLKRVQDDTPSHRSAIPRDLIRKLRRIVPFAASHRRCEGQRCFPAEMLMKYLTPCHEPTNDQDALIG